MIIKIQTIQEMCKVGSEKSSAALLSFFLFLFFLGGTAPMAYGSSQARGRIGTIASPISRETDCYNFVCTYLYIYMYKYI